MAYFWNNSPAKRPDTAPRGRRTNFFYPEEEERPHFTRTSARFADEFTLGQDAITPDDPRYIRAEARKDSPFNRAHDMHRFDRELYQHDHMHGTTAGVAQNEAYGVDHVARHTNVTKEDYDIHQHDHLRGTYGSIAENEGYEVDHEVDPDRIHRSAQEEHHHDHQIGETAGVARTEGAEVDDQEFVSRFPHRVDYARRDHLVGVGMGVRPHRDEPKSPRTKERDYDPDGTAKNIVRHDEWTLAHGKEIYQNSIRPPYKPAKKSETAAGNLRLPHHLHQENRYEYEDPQEGAFHRGTGEHSPKHHLGGSGMQVVREQPEARKMLTAGKAKYDPDMHLPVGGFDHIQAGVERLQQPYYDHYKGKMVYPGDEVGYDANVGHGKRHGYGIRDEMNSARSHFQNGTMTFKETEKEAHDSVRGKKKVEGMHDHYDAHSGLGIRQSQHMHGSIGKDSLVDDTGLPRFIGHGKHRVDHEEDHYDGMVFRDDEVITGKSHKVHAVDQLGQDLSPSSRSLQEKTHGRKHIMVVSQEGGVFPDPDGTFSPKLTGRKAVDEPGCKAGVHFGPGQVVEVLNKPVGRAHIESEDHIKQVFSPLATAFRDAPLDKPLSAAQLRSQIEEEIADAGYLSIGDPQMWGRTLIEEKGSKWEISAVDMFGNTVSREGTTADDLARALCALSHVEMRMFGLRARMDPLPEGKVKKRHNPSMVSTGMNMALTFNENELLNQRYAARKSVQDGTRFGQLSQRAQDPEFEKRGTKHLFDNVRQDHFVGGTFELKEEDVAEQAVGAPDAAGHMPRNFYGGLQGIEFSGRRRRIASQDDKHLHLTPDWHWSNFEEKEHIHGLKKVDNPSVYKDHLGRDMMLRDEDTRFAKEGGSITGGGRRMVEIAAAHDHMHGSKMDVDRQNFEGKRTHVKITDKRGQVHDHFTRDWREVSEDFSQTPGYVPDPRVIQQMQLQQEQEQQARLLAYDPPPRQQPNPNYKNPAQPRGSATLPWREQYQPGADRFNY
ncbi:unnamed protein product [Amoebophrya sp. A120]|nr:unnamed protein product [Amoebophrya sp. A120]|eukprot:GSA120T00018846001.1